MGMNTARDPYNVEKGTLLTVFRISCKGYINETMSQRRRVGILG